VLPEAPVPILAEWLSLPARVRVTFDRPLTADPALDPSTWYAYRTGFLYTCTAAAASGSQVLCSLSKSDPAVKSDSVTYQPPPFDVLSSVGVPAAAFLEYPIT
jgi:hypothetical protein